MGTIIAVCRSDKKGVPKQPVAEGLFQKDFGMIDDAHADAGTHRQVSLLAIESIDKMRQLGMALKPGDFAENLTTQDIDLLSLPPGARLSVGKEALLEISQIGKECHVGCAIFRQVGQCIMPTEGIFARVLTGGVIRPGDRVEVVSSEQEPLEGR